MHASLALFALAAAAVTATTPATPPCDGGQCGLWNTFLNTPVDAACTNNVATATLPGKFFKPAMTTDRAACPPAACLEKLDKKISVLPRCTLPDGSSRLDVRDTFDQVQANCKPTEAPAYGDYPTDAPTPAPTQWTKAPPSMSSTVSLSLAAGAATLVAAML